jgi:hypothetical protein
VYLLVGISHHSNPLLSIRLHLHQQTIQILYQFGLNLIALCEKEAFSLEFCLCLILLLDELIECCLLICTLAVETFAVGLQLLDCAERVSCSA